MKHTNRITVAAVLSHIYAAVILIQCRVSFSLYSGLILLFFYFSTLVTRATLNLLPIHSKSRTRVSTVVALKSLT